MIELYFGDLLVLENGIISPLDASKEFTLWYPEANKNTIMILVNTSTNTLYWISHGGNDIVPYNSPVTIGTYLLLILDDADKIIPTNIPREGFNRTKLADFGKLIFRLRFYCQQTTVNDIPEDVIRKISTDKIIKEKLTDSPTNLTPNQVNAIIEAMENTQRRIKLLYEQRNLIPGERGDREMVIARGQTYRIIEDELIRIIDLLVQYPKLYTNYLSAILTSGYKLSLMKMALERGGVDLFKVIWEQLPEYDNDKQNMSQKDINRQKSNRIEQKMSLIIDSNIGDYPELLKFVTPFLLNMGGHSHYDAGGSRLNRVIHILSEMPSNTEYRNAAKNTMIYLARLNGMTEEEIAQFVERFDSNTAE